MLWLRRTPVLAVLVFGIGVGLGLAWKTGCIPVELGTANTGSLDESEFADADEVSELITSTDSPADPPAELPEDLDDPEIAMQTEPTAADILGIAVKAEPPVQRDTQIRPSSRPERVLPATRSTDDDGPEWAREEPVTQAVSQSPARFAPPSVPAREAEAPRRLPPEIRMVANQDPPVQTNPEPSTDPAPTTPTLAQDLTVVDEQIANEEYLEAHRTLSKLYWNNKEIRSELLPRLAKTSRMIFFEPRPHFLDPYVVQANDQLRVIAGKYNISWEYIAKLNRTDPKRIQLGQKLKVLKGPFAAVVDLHEYALTVHLQGYFVKRYTVGIGKDGASPIGKFEVLNKVENPQYTGPDGKVVRADDPTNPLGERWIDLGDSYGIHGTVEPDSIGKAASRGCIRMREKDVIEVYDFLVKGSEVVIRK
ncbi:MAG: L,D-transpeptidase family protein [Planctomycetes bacterium]|nr:L,D-transpeptidase family protein [Planctomycetota bacterium]